jgi:L-arabinonolactonase
MEGIALMMKDTAAEILLNKDAVIAESPVWDHRHGKLVWADISKNIIWRSNISDGCSEKQVLSQPVGCVAMHRDNGYVIAGDAGFFSIAALGDVPSLVTTAFDDRIQKLNDGKVDPNGRFWAGTGCVGGHRAKGALYCLDRDRSSRMVFGGVTASNGFDWSPDGSYFYYVDTAAGGIDVFDVGQGTGELQRRRRFVDIPPELGLADGLTVDVDGCIWLAIWYAGAVHRYSPDGKLIETISVPVSRTSSCTFGGTDMRTLFITTAKGVEESSYRVESIAGAIFAVETNTSGQSRPCYLG